MYLRQNFVVIVYHESQAANIQIVDNISICSIYSDCYVVRFNNISCFIISMFYYPHFRLNSR